MTKATAGASLAALALGGLTLFGVQAPAAANHCPTYPPQTCSHPVEPIGSPAPAASPATPARPADPTNPPASPATPARPASPTVSDTRPTPGQGIRVTSAGWSANTPVVVEMRSTPVVLGTFLTDGSGTLDATVAIPLDATPGSHSIVASGLAANGSFRSVSTPIVVVGAGATAPDAVAPVAGGPNTGAQNTGTQSTGTTSSASPRASVAGVSLPRTGTEAAVVAALGAGLVAAGAASMVAGRRKRQAAAV